MNKKNETPFFSIVLSNYNGSDYLNRCIDSMLNQTYDNYEIVCIDKGSTDSSLSIMKTYEKSFPGKIKVYQIDYSNSPATGRNYGVLKARAHYVTFADSDDEFESDALANYYFAIGNYDFDVIYAQYYDVNDGKKTVRNNLEKPHDTSYILTHANPAFWNLMIKRDYFEEIGTIPEDGVFEDSAYFPRLISHTEKIGYVSKPVYNHHIRNDSTIGSYQTEKFQYIVPAAKRMIDDCATKYVDDVSLKVALWMRYNVLNRWRFYDDYVEFLKEYSAYFIANDKLKTFADGVVYQDINNLIMFPDDKIPCMVYANGFNRKVTSEQYEQLKNNTFNQKATVIILNESNCDIAHNVLMKQLYDKGEYDDVGYYYALKHIAETGGVYIGNHVVIDVPINALRYKNAFFSYLSRKKYSKFIFGAKKDASIIKDLLRTYSLQELDTISISDRIEMILKGYNIINSGQTVDHNKIYIGNIYVMTLPYNSNLPTSHYHFTHIDFSDENKYDNICLKPAILFDLIEADIPSKENEALLSRIDLLNKQINEIYNSKVWKLTNRMRKLISTKPGKFIRGMRNTHERNGK